MSSVPQAVNSRRANLGLRMIVIRSLSIRGSLSPGTSPRRGYMAEYETILGNRLCAWRRDREHGLWIYMLISW
jgi:hypothetical protein